MRETASLDHWNWLSNCLSYDWIRSDRRYPSREIEVVRRGSGAKKKYFFKINVFSVAVVVFVVVRSLCINAAVFCHSCACSRPHQNFAMHLYICREKGKIDRDEKQVSRQGHSHW